MKRFAVCALALTVLSFAARPALSHCEIPCGIYDDQMRISLIEEHIATIEKSMKDIVELSKASPVDYNQIVRWTMNKDTHADELQHIVSQYFLTQRVKPTTPQDGPKYDAYIEQVKLLHEMLIVAMKCKQTTDLQNVDKLRSLTSAFAAAYFGPGEPEHKR
jgi:nickel superoxide dismutase